MHLYKLIFILLPLLLLACHGSENDFSVKYEFTAISLENAENTGAQPATTTVDSIPAEAYLIKVNLTSETIAEGTAYADSDHPAENLNPFDSIHVTSNASFGASYPAGSILNEKFVLFNGDYFHVTALDQLSITNSWKDNYDDYPIPGHVHLMLIEPPTLPSTHVFTVQFFLEDGTILVDSTSQITLY